MNPQKKLEEMFAHFPGIGPRQAKRFVYFLLSRSPAFINELIKLVQEIKTYTNTCSSCYRYYNVSDRREASKENLCSICSDLNRDHSLLMIVSRDSDFESVEKSGSYNGTYFVLGGTISLLDQEPEKHIRISELESRLKNLSQVKEIILCLSTTPEGENTEDYIKKRLGDIVRAKKIKVTELARGLSTGAEIEYADKDTIKNAIKNRH